ncbi:sensor histidine kinase [Paenibacillus gansuensis]|uniref:Histidine kinase n=1 Tax=Paenibacillus gansuensis TaxID=306542 RepID=A0ABW5PGS9_9BACL
MAGLRTFFNSLHVHFLLVLFLVITPPVYLFYQNNLYAMNQIRHQVSESTSNLLTAYARNMDRTLLETQKYLVKLRDVTDVTLLNAYPQDSDEYRLARKGVSDKLSADIGFYNQIDALFVYSASNDDMLIGSNTNYYTTMNEIKERLPNLLNQKQNTSDWSIARTGRGYVLTKIIELNAGLYAGAWIEMDTLTRSWNVQDGERTDRAMVVGGQGEVLTQYVHAGWSNRAYGLWNGSRPSYAAVESDNGMKYLAIGSTSSNAPLSYVVLIEENRLLDNLTYYQRTVYWTPAAVLVILLLYFMFYRNIIYRPIKRMIFGMKRLSHGQFDIRLQEKASNEFRFLMQSFNHMAAEIEHLKISVYDEQLRAKNAEFKHLQAQINPHFYMNSMNVVYSLAEIREYSLIQQMAVHLVDYFRFATRTNRSLITLEEELLHIRSYMEIQKLRFPGKLAFECHVYDRLGEMAVPPLMVQPFVENAVKHGMMNGSSVFTVSVEARLESGSPYDQPFVIITVTDNGRGFTQESLHVLSENKLEESWGDSHLGIWNVLNRLQIKYGDSARVRFANGEDSGAVVTIFLPYREQAFHADAEGA